MKPNIYLDVDGVILANDKHAANHVHEFLRYVTTNYTCYWLTMYCRGDATTVIERLSQVLDPVTIELCKTIKPTEWYEAKTDGIDFDGPFLWFDDNLSEEEQRDIVLHGALRNWIEVDLAKDPDRLRKLLVDFPTAHSPAFGDDALLGAMPLMVKGMSAEEIRLAKKYQDENIDFATNPDKYLS